MNMKLICSLIAILLAVTLCAAGCQEKRPAPEAAADAPVEESVQSTVDVPAADTLLCTVNGKEITYGDLQTYIQGIMSMYVNDYGYEADDPELISFCNQSGMLLAQQYIILDELGEELNVTFTGEEQAEIRENALTTWNEIISYYEAEAYGISEVSTDEEKSGARTGVLALLESMGYTEESFIADEIENARTQKIMSAVCKDITVTDTELDEYIASLVAADQEMYSGEDVSYYEMMQYYGYPTYYRPDGYRAVTHILLNVDETLMDTYSDLTARFEEQQEAEEPVEGTEEAVAEEAASETTVATEAPEAEEETVTAEQVEAARKAILDSVQSTVDEIMEKFNAGTPFADLIAEYGNDPGMQQEGATETGYNVAATSLMWDIPFRDGAMSIEQIGGVSEPVVGANGVHIIYYLKDVPGGPVELSAEEREEIRNEILGERQNELLDTTIEERMSAAVIVYTDEAAPFIPVMEEEETDEVTEETDGEIIGGADEPSEIVLTEETPAEEVPAEETPAEETPVEEVPAE